LGRTIVYGCVVPKTRWVEPPAGSVDELYRAHAVGMIRFALLLTGDQATAEDVVHDALAAVTVPPPRATGWGRQIPSA
jgi:DNA-directed RNA polymerase specialized sigma24 family protein